MKESKIKQMIHEEIFNVKWGIVSEEIDNEDLGKLRELIRKEVSAIFFDLFKKRKTWGA